MTTMTGTITLPRQTRKPAPAPVGRVPRVARLMALAIRLDGLLRHGDVGTQSELAELGGVTRARLTQILNMSHLAPDLQEQILHLPPVVRGRDPVSEPDIRPIAALVGWDDQRRAWDAHIEPRLLKRCGVADGCGRHVDSM